MAKNNKDIRNTFENGQKIKERKNIGKIGVRSK